MRVEFPKVLRVLSHELRGQLGVMQGYVRLLKTRRADDDSETRMLTAILEATGRITAIARQASDLAMWQDGRALSENETLSARMLVDRAVAGASTGHLAVDLSDEAADVEIATPNAGALSAAIAAVVDRLRRDVPHTAFAIRARAAHRPEGLTILIGPEPVIAALPEDPGDRSAQAGSPAAITFDAGGHGLALVLAATVLDAHRASVEPIPGASGVVRITLLKERG